MTAQETVKKLREHAEIINELSKSTWDSDSRLDNIYKEFVNYLKADADRIEKEYCGK